MSGAPRNNLRADLGILLISAIWGSAFVFVKRALEDVSPILFVTLRFGLGTLLLAGFYRGRCWPDARHRRPALKAAFITGAILFVGYALQTPGARDTTAVKAGFLTSIYIPLVPFLGAIVYRNRLRPVELAGIGLATLGSFLMTLPSGWDFAAGFPMNRGDLLVIAATAAWAMQIIVLGHYSQQFPAPVLAVGQIATSALLGGATFWWVETPRAVWSGAAVTGLLFAAAVATALAFAVQSWAQRHVSANRAALLLATEPLFAWAAAYALAGETLGGRAILGAFVILASVLLVELKPAAESGHPSD